MSRKEAEIERLRQKMSENEDKEEVAGVSRRKLADSCFKAVTGCRFSKVKFLLDNGVAVNIKNDKGQNLLVAALYVQDEDRREKMFRYLLRRGVPCEGIDDHGRDVLSWACLLGRPMQVHQVLEAAMGNIDLHRQDSEGMTPLHHATRNGHIEVVRILVRMMNKFRLTVDVADVHGLTPYIYARRLGHHDIAGLLVKDGNASTKQFDSQKYKSADEWAMIGAEERKIRQRQSKEKELALYKIRGRLPPMETVNIPGSNVRIPKIQLSYDGDNDSIIDTYRTQSRDQYGITPILEDDTPANKATVVRIITKKVKKRKPKPAKDGTDYDEPPTARSVDTAFTLLNLKPKFSLFPGHGPTSFVNSELDTSDNDEASSVAGDVQTSQDAIPSIMEILSEQQCLSFRAKAKMPSAGNLRKKPRSKMSTLAILMGKGNKGQQHMVENGTPKSGRGGGSRMDRNKRKPVSLPQLANS